MIEHKARIVMDKQGKTWIQTERQSSCGQCSARKACGTALLAEHVGKRFSRIAVADGMRQGQSVTVTVPEQTLLAGALRVYLLPLILMLTAALLTRLFIDHDLVEAVAGICGLGLGLFIINKTTDNQRLLSQIKVTEDLQ